MKKLLIWIAVLAPSPVVGDVFEFSEYGGRSAWLLLDDDRETDADPYPWGITAACDGNGGHEFSIALHGIVSSGPGPVEMEYSIGGGEPVVTRGFALDSILTGISEALGAELTEAVASGERIVLSVPHDSALLTSSFEEYAHDRERVEFVSNGCR